MWRLLSSFLNTAALFRIAHGDIILSNVPAWTMTGEYYKKDTQLYHGLLENALAHRARPQSVAPSNVLSIGAPQTDSDPVVSSLLRKYDSPHVPQLASGDGSSPTVAIACASAGIGVVAIGAGVGVRYTIKQKKIVETTEVDMEAEKYILEWSNNNEDIPPQSDRIASRKFVPCPNPSEFEPIAPPTENRCRKASFMMHEGPVNNTILKSSIPDEASHFEVGMDTFWMED